MTTRFSIQLPDDVIDEARAVAAEAHVSIDELLAGFVAQGIKQRRWLKSIRDRASRGDADIALSILDRVPDVEPDMSDRPL